MKSTPICVYCIHPTPYRPPLALGYILAYARKVLPADEFDLTPRFPHSIQQLSLMIPQGGTGIFLFSDYMWTVEENFAISRWVKEQNPRNVTIHGGPSAPAYPEASEKFLRQEWHIDYAVHSEGEQTAVELMRHLADSDDPPFHVNGLSFLHEDRLVQTSARERATDINIYPSPYLEGIFSNYEPGKWESATLETNRGCPYGCTYCDWGSATLQKIRSFDLDRVKAEIEWLSRERVGEFWIADANFGIFERDVEITRMICDMKETYGFPKRVVVNYAKNTHKWMPEIVELMAGAGLLSQGIISIQTRDPQTLTAVRRKNIKTTEYDHLRDIFEQRGLPLSVQLMIGLPGSTVDSLKEDLKIQFHQDIDVQFFRTVVLPNSPMADPEYIKEYEIEFDKDGMILSTATQGLEDMAMAESLARLFRCSHSYGMLRYFLSYLEWEHKIDPIDFMHDVLSFQHDVKTSKWLHKLWDTESRSSDILMSHVSLREELRSASRWKDFYMELAEFASDYYNLKDVRMLRMVVRLQAAVMPARDREYPVVMPLQHDFVQYYHDRRAGKDDRPLGGYPAGELRVDDPHGLSGEAVGRKVDRPSYIWELNSNLHAHFQSAPILRKDRKNSRSELIQLAPLAEARAI